MDAKGVVVVEDAHARACVRGPAYPAALEQVANRPIIQLVVDALRAVGIEDIVIVSSSDFSREIGCCLTEAGRTGQARFTYVETPPPLHLAEALRLAAPVVGSAPCIVHLADGLLDGTLEPLMCRVPYDTPDVVVIVHHGSGAAWHLSAATLAMLHISELRPERTALSVGGVCLFGPGALGNAGDAMWRTDTEADLTKFATQITAHGGQLHATPVNGWRRYAGDPLDLLELNRIALDLLDEDVDHSQNAGNRIEGRVWIHEHASVRASVIVGPAVIGARARVADAYIGPYTSIGADARIEGSEIERSIIAAGASITHVGGRLVASVVGRDARVFRDFSLPRALRLRVGDGTEIALC